MMELLKTIIAVTGLGLLFGTILAFVHKLFKVDVDARVEMILGHLPGANCGACGLAGCQAAAEAIVDGKAPVNCCIPNSEEETNEIAHIMATDAGGASEKQVARVFCNGGTNAVDKYEYKGLPTCSADTFQGGHKECAYACLGHGDCFDVCPFDAIEMRDGLPVINEEKCTACGKCVETCPRNIIKILPASQNVIVKCSSHDKGPAVRKACSSGCIGCGICTKKSPENFTVDNFLASASISVQDETLDQAIASCPTKVIKKL